MTFLELRSSAGLTQADLAKEMDVTQSTVSEWELGSCVPDTRKISRLATLLNTSTDGLLSALLKK